MAGVGGEAAAGGEAGEESPARRMLKRPLARSRPRGHSLVGPEARLFGGAALWARGVNPRRLHAGERLRWRSSAGPELPISPHYLCDRAGAHADQGGGRRQIHAGPCGGRPGAEASRRRSRGSRGREERTDLSRTGDRSVAQRPDGDRGWTAAKGVPRFFRVHPMCAHSSFDAPIWRAGRRSSHGLYHTSVAASARSLLHAARHSRSRRGKNAACLPRTDSLFDECCLPRTDGRIRAI